MVMQIRRTATPNSPPVGLVPGQLSVEMADPLRLWVGVPTTLDPSGRREITGRFLPLTGGTITGSLAVAGGSGTPAAEVFTVPNASAYIGGNLRVSGQINANLAFIDNLAVTGSGYIFNVPNGWALLAYCQVGTGSNPNPFVVEGTSSFNGAINCVGQITASAAVVSPGANFGPNPTGNPLALFGAYGTSNCLIQYIIPGYHEWHAGIDAVSPNTFIVRSVSVTPNVTFYFEPNGIFRAPYLFASVGVYQPGGGLVGDSSDARIKRVQTPYGGGLEQIEQIQPVVYNFLGNDTFLDPPREGETMPYPSSPHYLAATSRTPFIGIVAQDVEKFMPELVKPMRGYIDGHQVDDLRNLDATPLIYALVNAVKELSLRVRELEAKNG